MQHRVPLFIATAGFLLVTIILITLWARGYTLDSQSGRLEKTGMILVKSQPDGAKISVDGRLTSATNATLASIKPGRHQIRMEKEGYAVWRKDIIVQAELVTEINAVLVPLTPKLIPLTVNGAHGPALARDGQRLAFLNRQGTAPGLWYLNLSERSFFNLSRPVPKMLLADTSDSGYSRGQNIRWSPDDSEILLAMNEQGYYLLKTADLPVRETEATSSALPTLNRWQEDEQRDRLDLIGKAPLAESLKTAALEPGTLFSHDGRRFLYQKRDGSKKEYRVYDLSEPLPVGGQRDYLTIRSDDGADLKASWYSDSRHLLLFSCRKRADKKTGGEQEDPCNEGEIEIMEIDGANRTQIFRGAVAADNVFSSPDGSELIILTSFNQEAEPNLYAISLR